MPKPNLDSDKKLLAKTISSFTLKNRRNDFLALKSFLDDLLTEEEILDLSQRIKIARLILEGKTYDDIAKELDASTSTVSKIGQIIKYGKGSFAKILKVKSKKRG